MNIRKIASYILVAVLLSFLFWNIFKNWQTVSTFDWKYRPRDILVLFIFLIPIYFINVFSWHLVTKAVGVDVAFLKNVKVWAISNLARFLPGGFWQYPGRILLLSAEGSGKALAATAVAVEMIFNLSVGSLIVLSTFNHLRLPLQIGNIKWMLLFLFFLPIGLSFLGSGKVVTPLVRFLQKKTGKGKVLKKIKLPIKWVPLLSLVYFLQYFFAGTSLFFLSRTAVEIPFHLLPIFIGIFTASWLLGYVTLFAPGGLGVQEASIAFLLSSYMPFPVAVTLSILFRLALFISELAFVMFVFLATRKVIDRSGLKHI